MRNSIGQEISKGDFVLHVSRSGSSLQFKVGHVTGFSERKFGFNYTTREPLIEPTVVIDYGDKSQSRGVGLGKVFKLDCDCITSY